MMDPVSEALAILAAAQQILAVAPQVLDTIKADIAAWSTGNETSAAILGSWQQQAAAWGVDSAAWDASVAAHPGT